MKWLKDKYEREGAIGTTVFHLLLLLLFVFAGLSYTVPKPEQGILVNFGTSETGSGEVQPDQSGNPDVPQTQPEPVQPETAPASTPTASEEDVLTQDDEPAPEVPDQNPANETRQSETQPEKPEEPKPDPKPQISDQLSQALQKLQQSGQSGGSEGDDDQPGDKGQIDGDPQGTAYTGGGSGGGNYLLGNRKALVRPKPDYLCQEEGKVVIDIKVDRRGTTVSADVGKGTTNTAECLVARAKQAALATKWQPQSDAPFEQRGTITYHFILK